MSSIPRIVNFVDGTQTYKGKLGTCGELSFIYQPAGNPSPELLNLMVDFPANVYSQSPRPPKDNHRWSDIKKSGTIKMTDLSRSKLETVYFPVQTTKYAFALGWPSCSDNPPVLGPQIKAVSRWMVNVVPSDFVTDIPDLTKRDLSSVPDIPAELNSLRSSVVASNLVTYDLLTELAEGKKTAETILGLIQAMRHPIQSFLNFRNSLMKRKDLDPLKIKKMLERKWLEYRYAIMPLFYSIKDIIKLTKEKGDIYKTDRRQKEFNYTIGTRPTTSQKSLYSWTQEEVSIRISAVGRARFDPDELTLRLFDQTGLNPFKTAWELIPYSFVIDWFCNIGDWVIAQTAGLGPGAQQRLFCQSIKETRVVSTFVVDEREWKAERAYPYGVVSVGPFVSNSEALFSRTKIEKYDRSLFTTDDVHLQLDAYLNWKRMIDAWALSQRSLISALRKLK